MVVREAADDAVGGEDDGVDDAGEAVAVRRAVLGN